MVPLKLNAGVEPMHSALPPRSLTFSQCSWQGVRYQTTYVVNASYDVHVHFLFFHALKVGCKGWDFLCNIS